MNDGVFEKLKEFTLKEAYISRVPLDRETKIERDLGVTGDDAIEFIVAYGKQFNVDVSKFMAASYFKGEGLDIISPIVEIFSGEKQSKRKELTLGDLEKGIIAGRLDEDVLNK